jgi:hypothetical protein
MEAFKARFDTLRPSVIDFPTARSPRRQRKQRPPALAAWNNFSKAIDEALDVHVAQRVRLQLAVNRIVRALAGAANLHHEQVAFNKRWERREEPFNGFDSPPGRF